MEEDDFDRIASTRARELNGDSIEPMEKMSVLDDFHVQSTVHLFHQRLSLLVPVMQRNQQGSAFDPLREFITKYSSNSISMLDILADEITEVICVSQ